MRNIGNMGNMKILTWRSASLRAAAAAVAVTVTFILSGFTDGSIADKNTHGLAPLIERRTIAMQRFMFADDKDEEKLFAELSDIETYPALSDDFRSASSAGQTDHDRVINMKLEGVQCEARTRSYGIYNVNIKWYMSGYTGYYTENGAYRIRTSIVNGRQYIAEFKDFYTYSK